MNTLSPTISLTNNKEAQTTGKPDKIATELEVLLDKCAAGERSSQEQLYKKYYGKMMATCMRYLGNIDDAQDVLNAGFLKVFMNLKKFDRSGTFDGWVYSIVRNCIIDHIRSKVKYREMEGGTIDDLDFSVSESAASKLEAKDLMNLLNILPETSRLVFNMFAIEGFKHEEIAKILGISTGTTKWHVSESRRILKNKIENP